MSKVDKRIREERGGGREREREREYEKQRWKEGKGNKKKVDACGQKIAKTEKTKCQSQELKEKIINKSSKR